MKILSIGLVLLLAGTASAFKVTANYPNDLGSMYLRGNGCGLSWDQGVQMTKVSSSKWEKDLSC